MKEKFVSSHHSAISGKTKARAKKLKHFLIVKTSILAQALMANNFTKLIDYQNNSSICSITSRLTGREYVDAKHQLLLSGSSSLNMETMELRFCRWVLCCLFMFVRGNEDFSCFRSHPLLTLCYYWFGKGVWQNIIRNRFHDWTDHLSLRFSPTKTHVKFILIQKYHWHCPTCTTWKRN